MIGGPEPRRPIPAGDDPRRPRLPGHRNARQHRLSRVPGARRHGPDAAPDGGLRQRHRPRCSTPGAFDAAVLRRRAARRTSSARRSGSRSRRTPRRSSCANTSATSPPKSPRPCASNAVDPEPLQPITDDEAAEQFTAMAWTIVKLATLHRTIKPELLTQPNDAGDRGGRRTRRRRHHTRQPVHDRHLRARARRVARARDSSRPTPGTGTSPWRASGTNASSPGTGTARSPTRALAPDADGIVRIAIGAKDFGHGHWLDTGGRRRGFVVLRWLDNPEPPDVRTTRPSRREAS